MYLKRILLVTALALGLAASATPARAGGIDIVKKARKLDKSFAEALAYNDPNVLMRALEDGLRSSAKPLQDEINRFMGQGDLLAKGVTLYGFNFRLGNPDFRYTATNQFEFVIRDNYLYVKSTTPTSLGKWADPAFEIHFDVRLRATLSLPARGRYRIDVVSSVIDVPYIKIKPRSFTGGVATTVAVVGNAFAKIATGTDYIQKIADKVLRYNLTSYANQALVPVNQALAKLDTSDRNQIETTLDQARKKLRVLVTDPREVKRLGKAKVSTAGEMVKKPVNP